MWMWCNVESGTGETATSCIGGWIATSYGKLGESIIRVPDLDAAGAAANAAAIAANAAGAVPGFASQVLPGPRTEGSAADWAPFVQQAAANASIRRRAIALGAARAGISAAYAITDVDLTVTETHNAAVWRAIGHNAAGVAVAPGPNVPVTGIELRSGHTDVAGDLTFEEALGDAMGDLSEAEWSFAFAVYKMSLAAPPMSGVSLLETNHHYLTSSASKVAGIERQVLSEEGDVVGAVFRDNLDELRDVIWHKASHPLTTGLLRELGVDPEMSARLTQAGLGSAAIRVPFVEPQVRAAKAYLAMHKSVLSWTRSMGHTVTLPQLDAAVRAVETMPHVGMAPPFTGAPPMTRADFVAQELVPRVEAAAHIVAWCVGVLRATCQENGVQYSGLSVSRAYSIQKLEKNNPSDIGLGSAAYDKGTRFERNQVERGRMNTITMTDAN